MSERREDVSLTKSVVPLCWPDLVNYISCCTVSLSYLGQSGWREEAGGGGRVEGVRCSEIAQPANIWEGADWTQEGGESSSG